jgi:hypothetical protein
VFRQAIEPEQSHPILFVLNRHHRPFLQPDRCGITALRRRRYVRIAAAR